MAQRHNLSDAEVGLQKGQRNPPLPAGGEVGAGAKQRLAPLTLRQPDNRIPGPRRNVIVGDVSERCYFSSTTGAVSKQLITKYINSTGIKD